MLEDVNYCDGNYGFSRVRGLGHAVSSKNENEINGRKLYLCYLQVFVNFEV